MDITYVASETMRKFHRSDAFVRALLGPIGSGKSVACVLEMMRKSQAQAPHYANGFDEDGRPKGRGIRYTRWVVVRNTYRELLDTTMETFFDWVPKSLGHYSALNSKFTMHTLLGDGTIMHAEFLFRALDRPDDVKKLLSLEMTGMFLNEAREIPKAIMDMGIGRLGRYPSKRMGGPSWHGLIMDSNPPDNDHWWYKLFEENLPDNHAIFRQPSGVEGHGENLDNLPPGYYQNMQAGKDKEWVNVYVHGRYGFVMDGKPVWSEYKDSIHSTDEDYIPDERLTIYVGIDFGLTPAACFAQQTPTGQWVIFDELVTEDMGASNFSKLLNKQINHLYPRDRFTFEIYGDPAGDFRAQTDESTPFQILDKNGIQAWPTYTNDLLIRLEAVSTTLSRLDFAGNPAFLLTKKAKILRKAMAGGYKYKRLSVSGHERFQDKPDKGRYSHVADALQYLLLGGGEGNTVVGGYEKKEIDYSQTNRQIA